MVLSVMVGNGSVGCLVSAISAIVWSILLVWCPISLWMYIDALTIFHVGIGYESSFEAEILRNTQYCQIWGYDYTVKSFRREIPRESSHRTHFKPYDLGSEDRHGPEDKIPTYTLDTLMEINGSLYFLPHFRLRLMACQVTISLMS